VVGGIAAVVKTAPGPSGAAAVVRDAAALKIALGQDPSTGNFPARGIPFSIYGRRPTTRMGVLAVLRDAWNLGRAAGPDAADADLAALARAAAGQIPVRAHARTEEDIGTLLRVAGEWGFAPVLEGGEEAWMGPERLKKAGVGCVLGPAAWPVGGRGPEGTDGALRNAAILHGAGVAVALGSGGDPARLREQAILAARLGLPREAALRGVTAAAADLCGAGERLGRLAAGRDGDLVVFDGDPLEPATRVLLVVVDGTVAHEAEAAR
jgi:imidazolonepropionase-like amidohydrolase